MITIVSEVHRDGLEIASCKIGESVAIVSSRHGAVHKLCRELREAGVPDQPWEVLGRIRGGSIYWMADRTISERTGHAQTAPFSTGAESPSDAEALDAQRDGG